MSQLKYLIEFATDPNGDLVAKITPVLNRKDIKLQMLSKSHIRGVWYNNAINMWDVQLGNKIYSYNKTLYEVALSLHCIPKNTVLTEV
jgi:hypothetical protein